MEEVYKNNFLKDISTHSELLVYDWSNGGDIELVVEDIERIGQLLTMKYFKRSIVLCCKLTEDLVFQISIALRKNPQNCEIGAFSILKRIGQKYA